MKIKDLIPQREPFLFLDKVVQHDKASIKAVFTFKENLDFFKGHFPGNPIVPGVILNEACFQSAAALMALNPVSTKEKNQGLAVVARIKNAKFKKMVKPNDTITIDTILTENLSSAAYFKSSVQNQHKQKVLTIEFTCALVENN